ncbi:MAG: NAD(P)H-binding protein [Anaerolineales bacterium]|nr:NAD(P)H-binding protein [Anaerolineales bacterium]
MILITGSTGFIGRTIMRHLVEEGFAVRILLAPSRRSPRLARGVGVDVTLSSLTDERGIRAALVGVDTVIHLAGMSPGGQDKDVEEEVEGSRNLAEAAADAGAKHFIYLSHLGADPFSAYPILSARGLSEEKIRTSGVPYTIIRAGVIFGAGDDLTTSTAMILSIAPVFFMPSGGETILQPLWVEDLARCITWSIDTPDFQSRMLEIGGPEYLSYREIVKLIMRHIGTTRPLAEVSPPVLRGGAVFLSRLMSSPPVTQNWLDYLAVDRTTDIDTVARVFGLQPARMGEHLEYLLDISWGREFLRRFRERRA